MTSLGEFRFDAQQSAKSAHIIYLSSKTIKHDIFTSTPVNGDLKILLIAHGSDRNDAAKLTERPGRRWRMSKSPAFGEVAKAIAVVVARLILSPSTGRTSSTFQ